MVAAHPPACLPACCLQNLWVADVSSLADVLPIIVGLRNPDGSRMIRARYPNANPEFGFGPSLTATSWAAPTVPIQPAVEGAMMGGERGRGMRMGQYLLSPPPTPRLLLLPAPCLPVRPPYPNRTDSYSFIYYQGGFGGICSVPGFGYTETPGSQYWWCVGGGGGGRRRAASTGAARPPTLRPPSPSPSPCSGNMTEGGGSL